MDLIETKHFRNRWKSRVGKYGQSVRRLIFESIDCGNTRLHEEEERGVLIGLLYKKRRLYVIGVPHDDDKLYLKTVLTNDQANRLGWETMRMRIPDRFKQHICHVCGERCIPMTGGDRWFNKEKGAYETVIVCSSCAKRYGEWARSRASANTDTYLREVIGWDSSGTTTRSATQ